MKKIRELRRVISLFRLLLALIVPASSLRAAPVIAEPAQVGDGSTTTTAATDSSAVVSQPASTGVFGEPDDVAPYSPLFRNTNITATSVSIHPAVTPDIHADPFEMQSDFGFRTSGLKVPFVERGFEPENATFKLGPVFVKIRRAEGGVLVSDNINLTETDRKPGVIAIMQLDMGIILQLGEGFRLAVAGALVYLPLQGKFGPAGYGLNSGLGFNTGPVLSSQMTYDTVIGGWDVQFFDEISLSAVQFSNGINSSLTAFDGASFPWSDRAGVYVFGAPYSSSSRQSSLNYRYNTNTDQQYVRNTVGFQTTRVLPSDVRLTVRAVQENFWYNQNGRGMPSSRELATVSAVSLRENLRFKPFVDYSVQRWDPGNRVSQWVRAGVTGPITDQLDFFGSTGYALNSNGSQNVLWFLRLIHIAGPNTRESASFGRTVNTFDQEMYTHLHYSLNQVIGPSVTGQLFAMGEKVEDLTGGNNAFNNLLAGLRFTYYVSPRTQIRASGTYQYEYYPYFTQYLHVWTGQVELYYRFSDLWTGHLLYQYQNRSTDIPNNGYYENMVMLTLSRYFP